MSDALRWGILGSGLIARMFSADLRVDGHAIAAVGSRDAARAEAFASDFEIPAAYGGYEQLVSDPDVDVVYVATPHPFHAADAKLALSAGKHVLLEKPFTMDAREAREVVELAQDLGLVVMEAMWTRWLPHMVRLRELIAQGALGEVRAVAADHGQKLPTDPHHRLQDPALGGGALLDLGIYPVSFAWDILGAPVDLAAFSSPTPTGVDRQTSILLRHDEGRQSVLHCELDAAGPVTASVVGTEARVELDATWYAPTTFRLVGPDGTVLEAVDGRGEGRGMQFEAREIERRIREGQSADDVLPPSETVAVMGTLDDIRAQIGLRYPNER